MDDELHLDDELEIEDDPGGDLEDGAYVPEEPMVLYDTVNVDQTRYAALIHDSFGERHANVAKMAERGGAVTVLRVLGAMELEAKGDVQVFINGSAATLENVVRPGDQIYIVGKLSGGR